MTHPAFNVRPRPARRRPAAPGRAGFTLIEVLATLLLMGIALPVIMQAVSAATSAGSAAKRRTEAGALAESKLAELVATGDWQTGATSGDFGPDWPDYQWRADLQTWNQATQVTDVEELIVVVTWQGRRGGESLALGTLVSASSAPGAAGAAGAGAAGGGQ